MVFVEMRNHIIRRVDGKTKQISTIAGTGQQGFAGDAGPATRAKFSQPHSIALDETGAIYVADIGNHRIRRIDPKSGNVDSIAGNSKPQLPQDGQKARGNPILGPRALCIDGESLWIALREGHSIWRMDLANGILDHVAGTGEPGFAGDGGPARLAKFNGPKGIAVGPDKKLFVADTENNAVRMIDLQTGIISTIGAHASVADANNTTNATIARLNRPHGICAGPRGEVFVGDTLNHLVRRMK
jgi:DNA-binding beta-propeller fold protein YncE